MIIKEFYLGATKIKIDDEFMAKTPEEKRIRKECTDDIAYRINERVNKEEQESIQKIVGDRDDILFNNI